PPALAELWPYDDDDDGGCEEFLRFKLPWDHDYWEWNDLTKTLFRSRKFAAAVGLPVYRRVVPRDGWLWPVGRDVILGLASPSIAPEQNLRRISQSYSVGPIAKLVIAFAPKRDAMAAREGAQRLTVEGFRKDYQPLLSGDGWLSPWILAMADVARSLDQAVLSWLPS